MKKKIFFNVGKTKLSGVYDKLFQLSYSWIEKY